MDHLRLEAHLRELQKHLEEVGTDPEKSLRPDLEDRFFLEALQS